MTLIKSISGIRGTIGGKVAEGLTPIDVVKFTSAYGQFLKNAKGGKCKVVVGRDARISLWSEWALRSCIWAWQQRPQRN